MLFRKLKLGLVIAVATISVSHAMSTTPLITFSAQKVETTTNEQGSMLNGDAKINIGKKITITANKALIKYANTTHKEVSEIIIFGRGTLSSGKENIQFTNGIFNPKTKQITAEEIQR